MTSSSDGLCNIRPYQGLSHIQIANDSHLAIDTVNNINFAFQNNFISPDLSTNFISSGQLVDNNYNVHFSRGVFVHNQVKTLAKGSKIG